MALDHFVTLLLKSGLMDRQSAEDLDFAFQEGCRNQQIPSEVGTFCNFLVATDRLTEWQCEKLKVGKWKGFYLDNYLLLEQVGKGSDYASSRLATRETINSFV